LKLAVTENAITAVEQALKLSGNHGISRHNPLERHYRNVLCARIHSPQEDMVRIAAGRAALEI
jgi:alkylation response protein AidB-like acyl-CoA dehydrogenase